MSNEELAHLIVEVVLNELGRRAGLDHMLGEIEDDVETWEELVDTLKKRVALTIRLAR